LNPAWHMDVSYFYPALYRWRGLPIGWYSIKESCQISKRLNFRINSVSEKARQSNEQ
jgi:hypothetical protein